MVVGRKRRLPYIHLWGINCRKRARVPANSCRPLIQVLDACLRRQVLPLRIVEVKCCERNWWRQREAFRLWDTELGRSFCCFFMSHNTNFKSRPFFQQRQEGRLISVTCRLTLCLLSIYTTARQSWGSPLLQVCVGLQLVLFLVIFQWLLVPFLLLYLTFIHWVLFVLINGKCTPFCSAFSVDYSLVLFSWLSCSIIAIFVCS